MKPLPSMGIENAFSDFDSVLMASWCKKEHWLLPDSKMIWVSNRTFFLAWHLELSKTWH